MPKRTPRLLLDDILTAIDKIQRYTAGLDQAAFLADDKTIDAVVRNLEIIGEASRQLPDEFRRVHADIPWPKMAGLRNRIVHDYIGIDHELVWHIIQNEVPDLRAAIQELP